MRWRNDPRVGVAGDFLEPLGPVIAAPGEDLGVLVRNVQLNAIAVELDLRDSTLARRDARPTGPSIEVANAGSMNPGVLRLDYNRRRFLALKRQNK
jgi:hypothetical protein